MLHCCRIPFFHPPPPQKKKNPIRTGRNHATSRRSTSQHPLNPKSNCQLKKKHRLLFSTRASRRPHTHTHAHTLLAHTLTRVCEFNALNLFHLKIYLAFVLLSPSHLTPNSSSFLHFRCFFFLPSSRKVINTRGRPLNPSLSLAPASQNVNKLAPTVIIVIEGVVRVYWFCCRKLCVRRRRSRRAHPSSPKTSFFLQVRR